MGINNCNKPRNSGFTLVELSIVVTIIAILIAGVFSGQTLVKQAKLQNVIKELKEYETAIRGFKDKFKYYPGDLPNATTYWAGTTNGNGNWQLNDGTEDYQLWSQLALSGFIPGTYTGAISGTNFTIGVNAPKSAHQGGGYDTYYNTSPSAFQTTGNALEFGSATGNVDGWLNGQILTPADAYSLDSKIDDGRATSGNLYGFRSSSYDATAGKCVDDIQTASSANYILSDTTISCRIWWWLDKNK